MTTVFVCLLLGNPEVHTKFELSSLIFFFFNILTKVLDWYICFFDRIFIINTEQLVIHECARHGTALHFTALQFITLCSAALHCTALHYTVQHCTALIFTLQLFTV